MSEETKKILRDKTQVEMRATDRAAILENIVGQSKLKKTGLIQNLFLPAGLVASFLFALLFFQSSPPVDKYVYMDVMIKNYMESEMLMDEISNEGFVYTDFQTALDE